eukprot:1841574-Prymnesium_polylepis.1
MPPSKRAAHNAANAGHLCRLRLTCSSPNQLDEHGNTPLCYAVANNQLAAAAHLLRRGAHAELRNNHGSTPLMMASAMGHADAVALLLENESHVDAVSRLGNTSLILAANGGHGHVVQLLLAAGANPKLTGAQGRTALECARAAQPRVPAVLRKRCADAVQLLQEVQSGPPP